MCLFGCWMTSCWIIVMKFPVAIFAGSRSFSPMRSSSTMLFLVVIPCATKFVPFVDKSVRHFTLMDDIWRQKIQCWANVQDFKMWNEGGGGGVWEDFEITLNLSLIYKLHSQDVTLINHLMNSNLCHVFFIFVFVQVFVI